MKMNNSAAKVGEIFTEAGAAFNRLAEMTMLLHPMAESSAGSNTKTPVKRKPIEDRVERNGGSSTNTNTTQTQNLHTAVSPISKQVTLNMLNAPEAEMEVDVLQNEVKLEFETGTEEVTSNN